MKHYVVCVWNSEDEYVPMYGRVFKSEEEAKKKAKQMLKGFKYAAVCSIENGKQTKVKLNQVWA